MGKIQTIEQARRLIDSHSTIMVGGFLKCGHPEILVKELLLENEVDHLTIISNDTATNENSFNALVQSGKVTKIHSSYIGGNRATGKFFIDFPEKITLYPQGSLAEKIRCGGAGLGGVLTPVGIGTIVEKDKEIIERSGKRYILEEALNADTALIYAKRGDEEGNLEMIGTQINFNPLMAMAAKQTIALVDEIVPLGAISPERIVVPGIYVNCMIDGRKLDE
ncbi:3-oxoacid CoA-transferase subunit A [uncultured Trichococcus sp.]|uniref:CoA transferase subunit A n=1 Tax=uncultured Trichococcus sp. TaxID=189665 RepID=UPI002A18BCFE|nr:3-oxoacid CoA-transferase subunit A [uncultured Trichococcus sp.]